ncbi:MAG: hypothetical protein HY912_17160 [Desulfomonile tiedjei]|uniref:Uncharacterized protein n=1 Tax=Desulfomonile tiedjei TaxID=2358 RepID=A0A9D6Z4R8_9BACT|nr:hypothetical protein [Desulfomonile tiedjei]
MRAYLEKIFVMLAVSVFVVQIGVAQAETSKPSAIPSTNIAAADNVVTLNPSDVPALQVHRRYRYRAYPYYYGYYPYYYSYGYSSYPYSYRAYPYYYRAYPYRRSYRPHARGW